MTLIPDVRIGWRDELVLIANSSFRTSTTSWSTALTGMNAAATSLTRTTGDGVIGRAASLGTTNVCAELVTTGTSGSGTSIPFTGSATIGRTYRASVWMRRTAGTTSAKLILGSNGTVGDRATTTMTLTATWTRYSVDWTPSGTRADARLVIANNTASTGTFRISLPEVYESFTQVGYNGRDEVLSAGWTRGANFDGTTESPSSLDLTLSNMGHAYDPDNASSVFSGLIAPGLPVSVRIVDTSVPKVYGAFYGRTRRFAPIPADLVVQVIAEDPFRTWMQTEATVSPSTSRNLSDFRSEVLSNVVSGFSSDMVNLDATGPETDMPVTYAAQRTALNVLDEINVATGSIHWVHPEPFLDLPWVYETAARTTLLGWSSAEHYDDTVSGSTGVVDLAPYDVTDEALVTYQRVTPTIRRAISTATVWEGDSVPFNLALGEERDFTAIIDGDPILDPVTVTIEPTTTTAVGSVVNWGTLVDINVLSAVGAETISGVSLDAARLVALALETVSSGSGDYHGAPIATELLSSLAAAQGLADWIVYRYESAKGRPGLTAQNRTEAHVSRRVGEVITITNGRVSWTAVPFFIRTLRTEVSENALVWRTTFTLEAAPAALVLFTIGGSAAQGLGGVGVLGL